MLTYNHSTPVAPSRIITAKMLFPSVPGSVNIEAVQTLQLLQLLPDGEFGIALADSPVIVLNNTRISQLQTQQGQPENSATPSNEFRSSWAIPDPVNLHLGAFRPRKNKAQINVHEWPLTSAYENAGISWKNKRIKHLGKVW